MRARSILTLFTLALAISTVVTAADPPRLAVILVIDQMRADYVDRFSGDWTSGLKRLLTEGARFTSAAYPYTGTLTCAGHATIATGAFPAQHGIFQNTWFDRAHGGTVTCTDDETVTPISYADPITGGDSAAALKITTLAEQMKRERGSRVVTIALKARSAIMLAGHGGDAVTWMSESPRSWQTSSAYGTGPVPEVAAFVSANPASADAVKIWEPLLPAERYPEADDGRAEAPPARWSQTFPHRLSDSGMADETFYARWERSPFADDYVGRMAAALAESMKLGARGTTDVLAISFSSPDLVGHAFGPNSREIRDMYARLDRTIGTLLDRLDALVGRGNYVVGLSSDHGVTELPEQLTAAGKDGGRVNTPGITSAIETTAGAALGPGQYVARINGTDVYFAPGQYEALRRQPAALQAVLRAIEGRPGVQRVFRSEELTGAMTSADPLRQAAGLSYVPGRSGDLVLVYKPGWINTGAGTTHGSPSADDQRVPLLFAGAGIKPGSYAVQATPADLAPTLAAIVGITLPDAVGHALTEAIQAGSTTASSRAR